MNSSTFISDRTKFILREYLTVANLLFIFCIMLSCSAICIIGLEWPISPASICSSSSKAGSVLLNLSYSFMAAFFFWFCTEFVTERYKQSKTLISKQSYIEEIIGSMTYIVNLMNLVEEGGTEFNRIEGKNGKIFVEKHYNSDYDHFAMGIRKTVNNKPIDKVETYSIFSFPFEVMLHIGKINKNADLILEGKDHLPKYLIYLLTSLKEDFLIKSFPIILQTHLNQTNRSVGFNLPGKIHTLSQWIEKFNPYTNQQISFALNKYDEQRTEDVAKEIRKEMYQTGDVWKNNPCYLSSGLCLYPYLEDLMQ